MFYDIPYDGLKKVKLKDIKTHSFIERECRLLQYVQNRDIVDLNKTEMDFSIYKKDIVERHIRIPLLEELYEKKRMNLKAFQSGKDIWKG